MSQIALPLEIDIPGTGDGYLISESNADIHRQLQNSDKWPNGTAILIGENRSGKSSMVAAFARETGGMVLDDAEREDDEPVFHLWNLAREEGRPLLLTSSRPVAEWGVSLPDLQSRLAASLLLEIGPPDERMIEGLLQQYFAKRGLSISQDALGYLIKRMERSYHNVELLAQKMDKIAIERQKSITLAIAKTALLEQQTES
ncbi:MAG: DnaA/Hda family protein [Parasphingorhabdus sp.]